MPMTTSPTIQGLRVRAVRVPMAEPHQTASGTVAESPLVLTDVLIDDGDQSATASCSPTRPRRSVRLPRSSATSRTS